MPTNCHLNPLTTSGFRQTRSSYAIEEARKFDLSGISEQNLRKAEEEGEKWRGKPKQAARTSVCDRKRKCDNATSHRDGPPPSRRDVQRDLNRNEERAARCRFSPFAHRHLSRYQCKSGEFSLAHIFCPWCVCLSSDGWPAG
ncbi:hypothetical protein Y032_0178g668 [Ancylostoma ceylanicum]|uniref:Uncharacterized protein n=1 Tax=Ancylostoma ceylanicum TaxID=53326 RepID=A0A016ST03_9BILA|nr:hypothetical protein Y032_0178g668 [Ancylostoma ceylanicum]